MKNTSSENNGNLISLNGMYENYFLDYASYVILERAIPAVEDGLKPVQRRILHSMKDMDDGRYHKVANIIGQTMQFHPHGDAAIGDALVNLGQKDLLIDTQGNWGDIRTGDGAAASRYIEARLTKFALDIAFNKQTTVWQTTYDGRKQEPITLPMKFPILLAQGVEGIAVGLSTKILPHNFIELVKASIQILKGNKVTLYPDFQNGGMIDVADYNAGRRGGKVKVRAKIESPDKKTLLVKELPYGVTTETLIESILKANDKGQIKIKKVIDNTAKDVEINIELQPGISPDVTIDALYAFTDCEISISPNACVIVEERPVFWDVHDLLKFSTLQTRALLGMELDIKKNELQEDWLFASLEKIFIEKRIYRDIEECETWEAVISTIETGLRKYVATPNTSAATAKGKLQLLRELTEEDFTKLTEIKIKRISKFNSFKADEYINSLQDELQKVQHNIDNLTEFTISYFDELLRKYGKGKERRTQILTFDTIQATNVVANNAKLYVNREEGFIGMGLKKDEFVADCSDIDDIIIFRKDGICKVVKIGEKIFVGKDIIHVAVWRKADDRSTYNLLYVDGKTGRAMSKRFNVTAVTRDKEYDLTTGEKGSKVLYFTANPNGEAEIVSIQLSQGCSAKTKVFDFDFGDLAIKGRGSLGNIVTKYPIKKIVQKEVGKSTLGAKKIWYDAITGRLNTDERGKYLGEFDTGDTLLVLSTDGTYYTTDFEMTNRYDMATLLSIEKITPNTVVSAIYYDGNKGWTMVKRFKIETNTLGQKYAYISDHKNSKLLFATTLPEPRVQYNVKLKNQKMSGEINLTEFIDIKGWKALGNKLSDQKLTDVKLYVSK
ncbi:MAG: DNA gyrase/topoisomerase IV subunit A [Saprospiraceae bacterium]|nr:DNA gyrase/topoisomerase IV subunit A [Saprospiraceae bacterium]MBP7679787.1 DNA gyrase/topoisomerase IV subunit A [Saprospiraceae bacterium]